MKKQNLNHASCGLLETHPKARGVMLLLMALLMVLPQIPAFAQEPQEAPTPLLQIDTGGHKATIKKVLFTPDGNYLVSAGDDKVIRVWDWRRGETVRELRGQSGEGHDGKIYAMAISPDGKWLATAGWFDQADAFEPCCGDIRLFDFDSGKLVKLLQGHTNAVYDLAFSPDGKWLASAGADDNAILWNLETFEETKRLKGHKRRVSGLVFTPDNKRLITASYDGDLRAWSLPEGRLLATMKGHETRIFALAISADGKQIASADADGKIRLWNATNGKSTKVLADQKVSIGALVFSKDGSRLLATCSFRCNDNPGQIVWSIVDGTQALIYKGHDDVVRTAALSTDGDWAVTAGGKNNEIHIWNFESGNRRQALKGLGHSVYAVGVNPDMTRLAWGISDPCPDKTACPNAIAKLEFEMGLPDKERSLERPKALAADTGTFIRAHDQQQGWTLKARPGGIYERPDAILEIAENGKRAYSIERDATDGFGHSAFTFTNEGAGFISGGDHGVLKAYMKSNGDPVLDYVGHESPITALAISQDGGLLISSSSDQTVRLWNLKTGELIVSLLNASNGDWVMWTPQGYYDSSPNGDAMVGWQINQGPAVEARYIRARQLKKHLHSPEIVRRAIILRSAVEAAKELRGTDRELIRLLQKKPPEFNIVTPGPDSLIGNAEAKITLSAAVDEEAPASFEVVVNNRNVSGIATRGFKPIGPTAPAMETPDANHRTINLSVPLQKGRNDILIRATNEFGYIFERKLALTGTGEGALDRKGRLRIVAIGVNNYPQVPPICSGPGGSCELSYAVADATAFLNEVVAKAGPLHTQTQQLLFVNGSNNAPTSKNIKNQIEDFLADSKPEDTTILFLAGHGINIKEDYFFVPTDAEFKNEDQWKRSSLVRWDTFAEALEDTEGTRLMFIDTCHAANAYNAKLEKQAGDARIVVFSATKANSVSAELQNVGHGVFTYALLNGLKGEADHSKDSIIKILELGSYTSDKVEQLTNNQQVPVFYLSGVEDFPLAQP